jgi:predicted ATPase
VIARIRRKKDADSIWVTLRSPETGKWYLILEEIMRTTKIQIRDILGIREFNMNGESIELSGSNGVGKSSVLDAIRYALTNKSGRDVIVRRGAVEGEILIETDSGLSIDRKSRINRADYKSIKQNGSEIGSPEAFLKEIFTPLQLNPIEFMAMDKKQQNAIILDMIQYDWDMSTIKQWFGEIPAWVNYDQNILAVLNDIQSENGEYYQNRRNIDRDRRNKIAFIEDIGRTLPEGYDAEKWRNASAGDIYRQIESIQRDNQLVERAKQVIENKNNKIRKFEADREIEKAAIEREFSSRDKQITEDITRLEGQIVSLRQEQSNLASKKADKLAIADKTYEASVAEYNAQCAEYNEYVDRDIRDTSELSKQAQAIEDMKAHINEYDRMVMLQDQVDELAEQSQILTDKIEKARTLPGEILEECSIPIEGLSVENGIPLINGLPISNLSEGEKLDLCIDVALQKPNGIQLLLIDGVEKLSTTLRNQLYKKCKDKGLQFIATRTTDDTDLIVTEL